MNTVAETETRDTLAFLKTEVARYLHLQPFGTQPPELYEPIRYILGIGGKHMRPTLCLLSHYLYKEGFKEIMAPALGIEVFHNFTLMHDDIMDRASLRRGKPTVHEVWNLPVAILSGDVMMVKAYELMMQVPDIRLRRILTRFSQVATEVCEGQQWDMNFETWPAVTRAQYLEMIRLKTAVLLGYSLELGAVVAQAPEKDIAALQKAGEYLGIAFQLQDDYLDTFGEGDKTGKAVGGDILARKKTILIISLIEKGGPDAQAFLTDIWNSSMPDADKVDMVKRAMHHNGVDTDVKLLIDKYFSKAFEKLKSLNVLESRLSVLLNYLSALSQRKA